MRGAGLMSGIVMGGMTGLFIAGMGAPWWLALLIAIGIGALTEGAG